ncbi:SCO3374 family protein [Streptomyces sp. NPDC059255]|uniref:SCO3374 family protein n=1 Tax=Streptomyces sp. NPDC059255 TaxID=3346793 RepID=UPI0036956B5E
MAPTVPPPRAPSEERHEDRENREDRDARRYAEWYEDGLGWATVPGVPGVPLRLVTGVRFDVLELPADAGAALLRRIGPACGPVALSGCGGLTRLLVAEGSADELPGLLDWLDWGGIALELAALGAGGRMTAPVPAVTPAALPIALPATVPVAAPAAAPVGVTLPVRSPAPPRRAGGATAQGAAVWLRPPVPGREVEPTLPALTLSGRGDGNGGSGGGAPDLVRLVDAAATECHRARLLRGNTLRANTQPLAFS